MFKIKISDWMDGIQDDSVPIRTQSVLSAAQVRRAVRTKIKSEAPSGPGRRRRARLAVLAAAAVLMASAAAAGSSQSWMRFFTSEAQAEQAAQAGAPDGVAGYSLYTGRDYNEHDMLDRASRILEAPPEGDRCYQADRLSDLSGVWDTKLDLSWLEDRYEAVPGTHLAILRTEAGETEPFYVSVVGEYCGENGKRFNLQYCFDPQRQPGESCRVVSACEPYQTADGMTAILSTAQSETGKSVFWVDLECGRVTFAMHGTQMEPDEIKEILDSLALAGAVR